MSSVDDLIGELFPGKGGNSGGQGAVAPQAGGGGKHSSWDSSSDEGGDAGGHGAGAKATHPQPTSGGAHRFDDDDDDDGDDGGCTGSSKKSNSHPSCGAASGGGGGRSTAKHNTIFTVAFPSSAATAGLPACASRCYVTNQPAPVSLPARIPAPTVEELRRVAAGAYDASADAAQMMLRKGAYYTRDPQIGNAALDAGPNVPANKAGGGGCPVILCRKCNYVVIRLQGAEWVDGGGRTDLYLTLRNYYPDWSRLASSAPVGVSEAVQAANGLVLRPNPACAAYCCQCSWLTVAAERAVIETKVSDAAAYMGEGNGFATRLPVTPGETRRPPLWVCKGHLLL